MAPPTKLAEDEESYYEEVEVSGSYTEEEYEEEVIESPVKPPHPLFGGGNNAALLNQIKARGTTPAASQGISQSDPAIRKSVPPPQPPKIQSPQPKIPGQMSMAEQVAMMAAKRQQRLEGGGLSKETPVSSVAPTPPSKPTIVTKPKAAKPPPKKKGLFGGGTAKQDDKASKAALQPAPQKAALPAAEQPNMIKSYKPEPIANPAAPATPSGSSLTQDRLKATGRREDRPAALEEPAPEIDNTPPPVPITTTTRTTTVTKTKRVIKSDPQYDMVEYKVGCFCIIM